jgi:hypothetical protein
VFPLCLFAFDRLQLCLYVLVCLTLYLCDAAEKLGEVWRLRQADSEDPLLDAVGVLELNWKLAHYPSASLPCSDSPISRVVPEEEE